MPFILGLTGGIGSGKSAASQCFEDLGIEVVDADIVSREVVTQGSPALEAIVEHFGGQVLLDSGDLDRAALRERIFKAPEEKQWLENLLHPMIRQATIEQLRRIGSSYGILSSPLLFEAKQDVLADRTLVIDCTEATQRQRALARDGVSEAQIKAIMATQLSREERQQRADDVIENNGSLEGLQRAVEEYHRGVVELTATR